MATGSAVAALLVAAAPASAQEPFRNVVPSGQGETANAGELAAGQASGEPPASFTSQNGMYTGLVGAAPQGGHRRDLDGDGVYEDSAAVALMDAWWQRLMPGVFQPVLGAPLVDRIKEINPYAQTPDGQGSSFFDGWHGYLDKDLRRLLGKRVRHPLSRRYCGRGKLRACSRVLVSTLAAAAADVQAKYGPLGGVQIRATGCEQAPTCDQIEFIAAGAVETPPIPWQDRPTFQQVVEIR